MRRELKEFEYICDKCGYTMFVITAVYPSLPQGWLRIKAPGQEGEEDRFCIWLDVCPVCVVEKQSSDPERL